jgi:hypothetical protein
LLYPAASSIVPLMTQSARILLASASLLLLAAGHDAIAQGPSTVAAAESFALTGTEDLTVLGAKAEAVEYRGRKAVRLTKPSGGPGGDALAIIKGVQFRDGTIEADIAAKVTTPPGVRMPGFIGIAFRVHQDPSRYELFYIRPGNSLSEDQAMRNHSVQYTSEPGFGWEPLRRQWPAVYEAYADLKPAEWTKIKIEVHGRRAKLYVNGSPNPSLVVDGMKGEDLDGGIGLWPSAGEEAYFSNLKITPAKPEPIKNGSDAAGTWDITFGTDAGLYKGAMNLTRDGNKVTGTWSGSFGADQPVTGTWRNGYIELTLGGVWPEESVPVTTRLAGWIDDDSGKGRMKAEGRAEGQWTALRKK